MQSAASIAETAFEEWKFMMQLVAPEACKKTKNSASNA